MSKFIYSFSIILFGLSLGYVIQILVRGQRIKLPVHIDDLRKLLQRVALLFINPIAKYYSSGSSEERISDRIKSLSRDPFILVALSSIIIGGLLNFSGAQHQNRADIDPEKGQNSGWKSFIPLVIIMFGITQKRMAA